MQRTGIYRNEKGQLALDLLLGLLILLIVLSAFGGVLNHFDSSSKEVSLHQQLRGNGIAARYLVSSSAAYFRETIPYAGNPQVVDYTNSALRSPGSVPLSPIHALNTPQGYSCASSYNPAIHLVTFSIASTDTQLPTDVTYSFSFLAPPGYDTTHSFSGVNCYAPFSVVAP